MLLEVVHVQRPTVQLPEAGCAYALFMRARTASPGRSHAAFRSFCRSQVKLAGDHFLLCSQEIARHSRRPWTVMAGWPRLPCRPSPPKCARSFKRLRRDVQAVIACAAGAMSLRAAGAICRGCWRLARVDPSCSCCWMEDFLRHSLASSSG